MQLIPIKIEKEPNDSNSKRTEIKTEYIINNKPNNKEMNSNFMARNVI